MVTKSTGESWMSPSEFARTLPRGIGLNLLVGDVGAEVGFCREVLGAMILHADEDFAAIELCGSIFMLHADHAYDGHPMQGAVKGQAARGAGIEIRVMGLDPDRVEARAKAMGAEVLQAATNRPHGLRECHIAAPSGFVWAPGVAAA